MSKAFGKLILRQLEALNKTRAGMVKAVSISESTGKFLTDGVPIKLPLPILLRLCKFLEISTDTLLTPSGLADKTS